jgi:hypothetical protein
MGYPYNDEDKFSPIEVVPYDPGVHLLPGYHLFGTFQIKERRIIQTSLLEMMGFNPVCMHVHFIPHQLTIYIDIYKPPIDISW